MYAFYKNRTAIKREAARKGALLDKNTARFRISLEACHHKD